MMLNLLHQAINRSDGAAKVVVRRVASTRPGGDERILIGADQLGVIFKMENSDCLLVEPWSAIDWIELAQ